MEECESLDTEMMELQEFQSESPEAIGQDEEDEVEELRNSLREVVQDQSVKPRLQCLMVDPSFSMVTVQSEDSGIVWETASSRCSTPWASETSSISEAYSMEGSGAQGKITIVFDEEKIVRRRKGSGGRSSRLADRLRRPSSSRSGSALGVERLEMAEVSVPNVKPEKTETGPDLEEIKDKDQQLFSLISEGYEILNIRVPSKLPTVDEEENTELQDNLSYLDQTPKIRSKSYQSLSQPQNHALLGAVEHEEESSQPLADTEISDKHVERDNTGDMDYFEKFTLLDDVVPGEKAPEPHEEVKHPAAEPQAEEQKPGKKTATDSPCTSDDSFVFVTDVEIAGDHLDEVFYGTGAKGAPDDTLQRRAEEDFDMGGKTRTRRESQRSVKDSGSVLFGSEDTILTPIFLSPGPPKIIDPILLEEPTAMSFMYSDLYEDAMGEKRKSDEEHSEAGSMVSERSFRRRLSDSEEVDGYLEMFILKDETPTLEDRPDSEEDKRGGRMMWSQNKFEMTACLTRVVEEEEQAKKEPKTEEDGAAERSGCLRSATYEEKEECGLETEKKAEEIQPSVVTEKQALPIQRGPGELKQVSKPQEEKIEDQEVKREVIKGQTEPYGSSSDKPVTVHETKEVDIKIETTGEVKERQRKEPAKTSNELGVAATQAPPPRQKVMEKAVKAKEPLPVSTEVPQIVIKPAAQTDIKAEAQVPAKVDDVIEDKPEAGVEHTEKSTPKEAALDAKVVAAVKKGEKVNEIIAAEAEALTQAKESETANQEMVTCTEPSAETENSTAAPGDVKIETVASEDAATVKVISDSGPAVQAVVEKTLDKTETQTQLQVALQEVTKAETLDVHRVAPGEEKRQGAEETVVERQLPETMTEAVVARQESEDKTEIFSTAMEPLIPDQDKPDTDEKLSEVPEPKQSQTQESVTGKESDKTELPAEGVHAKTPADDTEAVVQETGNDDELILLVPRGKVVEMDIEISQWSEKIEKMDTVAPAEPESPAENLGAPDNTLASLAPPHALPEDIPAELEPAVKPEVIPKEEGLPLKALDRWPSPPAPVTLEEAEAEEQKTDMDWEEDEGVFSPLSSFSPQEDLSGLHREDVKSETEMRKEDVEPETDMHRVTQVAETDVGEKMDLHKEDVSPEMEIHRVVSKSPEVTAEELEYDIISQQEAREMPVPEMERAPEEPRPESGHNREMMEMETEECRLGVPPGEEVIEADYDIIDAEEESQAREAAELQGMDWFCLTCGCLLSEEDCVSGGHRDHEVTSVDRAYDNIKERLSVWISELQGRSENIEDLVSELELAYNSVEDQCAETEEAMQTQNEEMMALVMEQYNGMSLSMEDEKKSKLEQLYDQIVSFQESIESTKGTLETAAREAETEARSPEDIETRLKAALESALSLELGPKGLLVFEDYAKGNTSNSHLAQRKGIPVPQKPTLQPQEQGAATSTSVTVYWRVNPGDIIDCFQVYCMEDPQGAVSEEYRVTVKESYCVLEELEPDKTYKVWVMAVNYTGCSLPSDRLAFRTAPPVPVIDTERCSVLWDSAILRWTPAKLTPSQSYTLEYCRQYELEGEGLRSIVGIKGTEHKVLLQPNENYLFYIKAVNEAGASEQSEAALISTKGTRFHLLKASAHPFLGLSEDQTTLHYSQDTYENTLPTDNQSPSILGELLPARGLYYWETIVTGSTAYRVGVAYGTVNRNSPLGENSKSWCLRCTSTPTSCRYQLLHDDVQSDVFVIEMPERVGTLLDYRHGHLSFYNAQSGQLLGTLSHRFTQLCHPALGLDTPGSLEVSMASEVPEFANRS